MNFKQFCERGYLKGAERFKKYETNGFRTPTGKVEISLSRARQQGVPPMPVFTGLPEVEDRGYPLILTSKKSRFYLHSSYRWVKRLRNHRPVPRTEIHPVTASRYGIREGDEILIETRKGRITQVAHLTDRVHPRVIYSDYGWWFPEGEKEDAYGWKRSNFNMLTSAGELGREFGTPNMKGIGCRVMRLQSKNPCTQDQTLV